ncbi:MAG: glutamate--cysteine ligase [Acidimicrobiaceae bacterium]|nr:glutamate--cysteine ligase [Acidimicrobiaceae bacterium]
MSHQLLRAPLTLGVEEEFLLVDAESAAPMAGIDRVLPAAQATAGEAAQSELHRAQIELATPTSTSLGEVRQELTRLRRQLADAAQAHGGRLVASGTFPGDAGPPGRRITADARYAEMASSYAELARAQLICGCHVHVGIPDPDLAVETMNRVRRYLHVLLALTANSPFSEGRDTGYASFRTEIWARWPTAGPPAAFASRAEYDALVGRLVSSGVIVDEKMAYWDVRPSGRYPTLEFRVSDVGLTVDDAVLVAGLVRALAATCAAEAAESTKPAPELRPELLRAAHWRAARSGLGGVLVDPLDGAPVPAGRAVEDLLEYLGDALAAHGDAEEVGALASQVLEDGNGADRQRRIYQQSGSISELLARLAAWTTG